MTAAHCAFGGQLNFGHSARILFVEALCKAQLVYCTISINSSATVTRDAPDENMVSSGGWNDRDKYKFSSGSRFFFSKLVGGQFFFFCYLKKISSLRQNDRDHRDISSIFEGPWRVTDELNEMVQ